MEQRMKKTDLLMAIDKANRIYTAILEVFPVFKMDKHSDLKKIYLVFSTPHGQCEMTGDTLQILKYFPAMISESAFKDKTIHILKTLQGLEIELKKIII